MSTQYLFLVVNLLGGCAVLGGYIVCLSAYPQHGEALWGGIQGDLRNVFIASMLLAASGYLVFCFYVIRLDGLSGEQSIHISTVSSAMDASYNQFYSPRAYCPLGSGGHIPMGHCRVSCWAHSNIRFEFGIANNFRQIHSYLRDRLYNFSLPGTRCLDLGSLI